MKYVTFEHLSMGKETLQFVWTSLQIVLEKSFVSYEMICYILFAIEILCLFLYVVRKR